MIPSLVRNLVLLRRNLATASYSLCKPGVCLPTRHVILTQLNHQYRRWTTVGLNSLRPALGSKKPRRRVGRGIGSGGRTCGRGHGGQKSRSGPGIPKGFEGGQTPFYLRVPKRGTRPKEPDYSLVGLDRVQHLIDTGRLNPDLPITLCHLKEAGINFSTDGVKIISRGAYRFQTRLVCLQATCFEESAIERIERLGGLPVSVYHDPLGLRWMRRPHAVKLYEPLPPPTTLRARVFYSSWEQRGYLHPDVRQRLLQADPSFAKRYHLARPMSVPEKPVFTLRNIPNELRQEGILPA